MLQRTRGMAPQEIVIRGRQEASKWWDRTIGPRDVHWVRNGHSSITDSRERFRGRVRASFFEGAAQPDRIADRLAQLADIREEILSAADRICQGRFDLMGYRGLDFGDPVDWHLDPVSGRRSPLVHWSRLNPLDPCVVGDSKVIWELNRHQWVLHLGQAYQFTGDEWFADLFAQLIQQWIQKNPVGMGINWSSSLEVAFRLIAWCWALVLFGGSRALSSDLASRMIAGIQAHAYHIERYLSHYSSPNTHLTGEALGLFYAGILFPELPRAGHWRGLGAQILIRESTRQASEDGVYFEQSTCYQRYTAELYLHFLLLAQRNQIEVPGIVVDRLQRLCDFLLTVRRPDGTIPQIGDADSGWVLPIMPRLPDDPRGVFSVAAAVFGRSDYAWAAGGLTPEVFWLSGPRRARVVENLRPTPPPAMRLEAFADGGYAVMRNGWERDAHQLIFDGGPLGCHLSGGHGHADLLSIQCSVFGLPFLVDPGTYCYTPDSMWRDFFRSTAAHSTVRIDGAEQAIPGGPFKWETRSAARLRRCVSAEEFEFVEAEHDAYRCLADPVIHRRGVMFVRGSYWVVVDDLEGREEHRVELRFQFAPIEVCMGPKPWVRAGRAGGPTLLIRSFSHVPLETTVRSGELSPIQGWVSPGYGQRQAAPLLLCTTAARLPLRVVTLLFPSLDPAGNPPTVESLFDEHGVPRGIVFEGGESVCFGGLEPVVTRAVSKHTGKCTGTPTMEKLHPQGPRNA